MDFLLRFLFPNNTRSFKGKRLIKISLRSLHLLGICGFAGGYFFNQPSNEYQLYFILAIISGAFMILIEFGSNGVWLIQNRGWMNIVKLVLIANISFFSPYEKTVIIAVIIFSGLISHAPGDFRYYSIFHQKKIERIFD